MLSVGELLDPAHFPDRQVNVPGQAADSDWVTQIDAVLDHPRSPVPPRPEPEAGPAPDPKRSLPWWPAGAVVVVLLAASLAVPGMRRQWALSFVRQPTHTTALSFRDAGYLPTSIVEGAPLHLSFTVANNEGRSLRYPYVVTSSGGNASPKVIDRSAVTVPDGAQRSLSVTVTPACTASPCRVQVTLPGHAESINVLLNLNSPSH